MEDHEFSDFERRLRGLSREQKEQVKQIALKAANEGGNDPEVRRNLAAMTDAQFQAAKNKLMD